MLRLECEIPALMKMSRGEIDTLGVNLVPCGLLSERVIESREGCKRTRCVRIQVPRFQHWLQGMTGRNQGFTRGPPIAQVMGAIDGRGPSVIRILLHSK